MTSAQFSTPTRTGNRPFKLTSVQSMIQYAEFQRQLASHTTPDLSPHYPSGHSVDYSNDSEQAILNFEQQVNEYLEITSSVLVDEEENSADSSGDDGSFFFASFINSLEAAPSPSSPAGPQPSSQRDSLLPFRVCAPLALPNSAHNPFRLEPPADSLVRSLPSMGHNDHIATAPISAYVPSIDPATLSLLPSPIGPGNVDGHRPSVWGSTISTEPHYPINPPHTVHPLSLPVTRSPEPSTQSSYPPIASLVAAIDTNAHTASYDNAPEDQGPSDPSDPEATASSKDDDDDRCCDAELLGERPLSAPPVITAPTPTSNARSIAALELGDHRAPFVSSRKRSFSEASIDPRALIKSPTAESNLSHALNEIVSDDTEDYAISAEDDPYSALSDDTSEKANVTATRVPRPRVSTNPLITFSPKSSVPEVSVPIRNDAQGWPLSPMRYLPSDIFSFLERALDDKRKDSMWCIPCQILPALQKKPSKRPLKTFKRHLIEHHVVPIAHKLVTTLSISPEEDAFLLAYVAAQAKEANWEDRLSTSGGVFYCTPECADECRLLMSRPPRKFSSAATRAKFVERARFSHIRSEAQRRCREMWLVPICRACGFEYSRANSITRHQLSCTGQLHIPRVKSRKTGRRKPARARKQSKSFVRDDSDEEWAPQARSAKRRRS